MNHQTLLSKPEPPEDWECCQSGCGDNCVYEIYAKEKQAYEAQQAQLNHKNTTTPHQ
ncbi:oxidoreductase-like domain-containing protein [Moraxella nasicaprae]|uniref:Oxidoreductase-like domain-containing protein n=1 Tax=Moraxella nasicaprae TaxID=2904122 RepID=A0ABY6F461_9GAMM|nr:oxidoreductase-like domain-containing protein [Moraxella nasicaprae]UXZ04888.1 oxidoreductase-like domain-containing protein [Moraxella nasicaprae]